MSHRVKIKLAGGCLQHLILLVCVLALTTAQAAFQYANTVTTTGGQFSGSYSPSNLINNGFTSSANTIDTTVTYLAGGNNYATVNGTTADFNLTFNFNAAVDVSAMHVWNYVYRSAGGTGSTTPGVNGYSLTFYAGTNGAGSVVGTYSGNLNQAVFNAIAPAQTVNFGTTNQSVRSVVMTVTSNFGGSFTGMSELGFETSTPTQFPTITSFQATTNLVLNGGTATLNWQVGTVTNLVIDQGIGNVLSLTTNGLGSLTLTPPMGATTYALTANGVFTSSITVVRLPPKEKIHIYLLIGQSNMQGAGAPFNAGLDGPQQRVMQFGSRDGMESQWIQAHHPLTSFTANNSSIGMGLEFAKTMLASNSDPDVVIGLINHAIGASAIQWWFPNIVDNKQTNPATGLNYILYNEAIRRATNAANYGVIKGVLWHQGEYNSNAGNSNPLPESELYAIRLKALVDFLRRDLGNYGLPFVCGKFVPTWTNVSGQVFSSGLTLRATVEAALVDLPNQRFNTACVDNLGLIGREDQAIHFDAASQRTLGIRYAQKLLAINAAMSAAPTIGFQIANGQAMLTWPSNYIGWTLQSQTNSLSQGLGSNWSVVTNSSATNRIFRAINPSNGNVFFRLKSL